MSRRSRAALGLVAALLTAIALGWGLPHLVSATTPDGTSPLAASAVFASDAAVDAVVAAATPVVDAIATRADGKPAHERVRDVLGATTLAAALLLLVSCRRRLSIGPTDGLRAAVVAHGGRAPPA